MQLFDANVQIGRYKRLSEGMPYSTEDLLADMNRFGIAEALVTDSLSREVYTEWGNQRVLKETRHEPRLHPTWALMPARTGEIGPLDTLLERMHSARVRAVRLFPGHYTFSLEDWCIGDLLDVLEEGRIVTFIDSNPELLGYPMDATNWEDIVHLCRAHPDLPVVVSESRFRSANRMMYQALETCPNLHFELSGFWAHRGIEYVCREFGAERLLFGTKWPVREIGGVVATTRYAEISDADRAKIAGDNLRGMLAAAHPQKRRTVPDFRITVKPPESDTLRAKALRGERPAGEVIIDSHAHLSQASIYHLADSSPAEVEREMERLGVLCSIVFGFSGVIGDWTYDNDQIAQFMMGYPGRYYGLLTINPTSPTEARQELDRCDGKGFVGVKLIPHYQGYPEDGPNLEIPVAWANERKLIVLNHSWGPVGHLRRLADKYPDVTFIIGHYSLAYGEVVNNYPNVYQCTCEPLGYNAMEMLTDSLDTSKIVYGSDVTDLPIPLGMGPILHARIPEADKKKILGLNALQMLRGIGVDPLDGRTV